MIIHTIDCDLDEDCTCGATEQHICCDRPMRAVLFTEGGATVGWVCSRCTRIVQTDPRDRPGG